MAAPFTAFLAKCSGALMWLRRVGANIFPQQSIAGKNFPTGWPRFASSRASFMAPGSRQHPKRRRPAWRRYTTPPPADLLSEIAEVPISLTFHACDSGRGGDRRRIRSAERS